MNKKLKIILVIIGILILIVLNLLVYINAHTQNENTNTTQNVINTIVEHNIATEEETEQSRKEMLNSYPEATRMKVYVGQYISAIDSKDYETAYNLLYENFRNTYFKTLEDFQNYAEQKYPDEIVVEYLNMEREGTMYIVTISITDPLNRDTPAIQQNIVIQENDLNDFVLSFNVE